MAPLRMWLVGMTVIMGKFGLRRVTGLRPTLLVGQVLVRRQSTLPSPRVFLQVAAVPMLWFRKRVEAVSWKIVVVRPLR